MVLSTVNWGPTLNVSGVTEETLKNALFGDESLALETPGSDPIAMKVTGVRLLPIGYHRAFEFEGIQDLMVNGPKIRGEYHPDANMAYINIEQK